jgi:pimeloyl-ACP methyl ester carboxylesterase
MKDSYCNLTKQAIHYLEGGSGDTLILIPSLWLSSYSYREIGEELSRIFRVIIPDIYKGKSRFSGRVRNLKQYGDLFNEFLTEMKIDKYYLVGISASGFLSTYFVNNFLHTPEKLLLFSTSYNHKVLSQRGRTVFLGYLKLFLNNFRTVKGAQVILLWLYDSLMYFLFHPRQFIQEVRVGIEEMGTDKKPPAVPTTLFVAADDEFLDSNKVVRENTGIEGLKIETVEGGHTWFFTDTVLFLDKIVSAITSN